MDIYKYDDLTVQIDFSANAGMDLTGWKFYRTIKKNLKTDGFSATPPNGYQLEHEATAGEISAKIVTLTIPAAIMATLDTGKYWVDLKIVTVGHAPSTVLNEQVNIVATPTRAIT